jgi:hypothetical protein
MTQKWISSFGSAVDAYTDYRRTGYPILFNPEDPDMAPGGFVQPPVDGDPVINPGKSTRSAGAIEQGVPGFATMVPGRTRNESERTAAKR